MSNDDLDAAAQPHCPACDVVMRDHPRGWQCPECRFEIRRDDVRPAR